MVKKQVPMNSIPRVTVLMPVYNAEKYVKKAIDSILNQTFKDFEFLLINDGSTDKTPMILQNYHDPRIKIINHEKNLGIARSLNGGIEIACGEYIARMDADDISLQERLMQQVAFLDQHPEIGVLGAAMEVINDEDVTIGKMDVVEENETLQSLLLVNNVIHHPTIMVRARLMKEAGGYNEKLPHVEDYDLWRRLSRVSQLANLPDVLVRYRRHDKNITVCYRQKQLKAALDISLSAVRESLKGQSLDKDAYQRFWRAYHGCDSRLQSGDIRALQPFWALLAGSPTGSHIWGSRLFGFANSLIKKNQAGEGYQLLKVVTKELRCSINWKCVIKNLIELCAARIKKLFKIIKKNSN
jgi:glycosyltransferase involved in cell wall biosynthesis